MAIITVYGIKACDTCRKAVKALQAAGHDVTLHDVRADPVSTETLQRWLDQFGSDLINRRSTTWRGLDDTVRSMPEKALLLQQPAVMKRPVIDAGDAFYLGWGKPVQAELGL